MFEWIRKTRMKREIIVNVERLETRVAVLENGRLEEFYVEHPTEERIIGSIYKGRIQNLEHDLQAAFVDIGLPRNAFLHYWDMVPDDEARLDETEEGEEDMRRSRRSGRRLRLTNEEVEKRFPPGSEILVQVTKGAVGTKGPRVTASLSIPGRYLVMMPGSRLKGISRKIEDEKERERLRKILDHLPAPPGMGLIIRTAGEGASRRAFEKDLETLGEIWADIQSAASSRPAPCGVYQEPDLVERVVRDWFTEEVDRVVVDDAEAHERLRSLVKRFSRWVRFRVQHYEGDLPIFDHFDIERQIEEAFRRKVPLKCSGYIVLDETEALIAVDVNTGKYKGTGSQEEAILQVNTEAVEEVARQLRLRNIGGLVVVDLIDMKSRKHQHAVFRAMREALKRDRARTHVLPISELGLLEMSRQRAEESIRSTLFMPCPYCRGRGNVKSPLSVSVEIQRQLAALLRKDARSKTRREYQIIVHPNVLERLRAEDERFLVELEREYQGRTVFRSDPARHVEVFEIRDAASGNVVYSTADRLPQSM